MSRARWVARELGPPLAGIAGLIVVWAVAAAATSSSALPSPLQVWDGFVDGMRDGSIPEAAAKTLIRLAVSFAAAILTLRERTLPAQILAVLNASPLPFKFAGGFFLLAPSLIVIFFIRKYLFNIWGRVVK